MSYQTGVPPEMVSQSSLNLKPLWVMRRYYALRYRIALCSKPYLE